MSEFQRQRRLFVSGARLGIERAVGRGIEAIREYAFAVFLLIAAVAFGLFLVFYVRPGLAWFWVAQKDAFVTECLETERYTRDECIQMAGGGR